MAKLPRYTSLLVDETLPVVGQAASLALGVMSVAKVREWSDLDESWPEGLLLDPEQVDTLRAGSVVLPYLRWSAPISGHRARWPVVTIAVCPECGRWSLVARGTPGRCRLTSGCSGKPHKVSQAKKVPVARA